MSSRPPPSYLNAALGKPPIRPSGSPPVTPSGGPGSRKTTYDDITGKLRGLNTASQQRRARLQNVNVLFVAIVQLNDEIRNLGSQPGSSVSPEQLQQIEAAIDQLGVQIGNTDLENESLIRALLDNANSLMRLRDSLPDPGSSPGMNAVRTAIANVPPRRNGDDGGGGASQRAGYKHSKTNSRKYMVKKFRSLRGSLKRGKKRKRKTLRRKL